MKQAILLLSALLIAVPASAQQSNLSVRQGTEPRRAKPPSQRLAAAPSILKDCYYDGRRFSEGAVISGDDDVLVQCVGDKWVLK